MKKHAKLIFSAAFVAVVVIAVCWTVFVFLHRGSGSLDRIGQLGDSFGVLTSLFSLFSTALVGFALLFQIEELRLLKEELKQQREQNKRLLDVNEEDLRETKRNEYMKAEPSFAALYQPQPHPRDGTGLSIHEIQLKNTGTVIKDLSVDEQQDKESGVRIKRYERSVLQHDNFMGIRVCPPEINSKFKEPPRFKVTIKYVTTGDEKRSQTIRIVDGTKVDGEPVRQPGWDA